MSPTSGKLNFPPKYHFSLPSGGLESSDPGSPSSDYLDSCSQESQFPEKTLPLTRSILGRDELDLPAWADPDTPDGPGQHACGYWAVVGECENGHKFAKSLDCGKEWCTTCKESAHGRRFGRWIAKAQKMRDVGYLVVTFPKDKRPRTKKELCRIAVSITRGLIRFGFKRGLRRWHFFGSKNSIWHPHLNFLFEAGYIAPEVLEDLKYMIRNILKIKDAVINYQYNDSDNGKTIHWIRYITRPTFLKRRWDLEMSAELYNFRNAASWGTWKDDDKWDISHVNKKLGYFSKVRAGICPVCAKKINWTRIYKSDELAFMGYDQIWGNIYQANAPPEQVQLFKLFKLLLQEHRNSIECIGLLGDTKGNWDEVFCAEKILFDNAEKKVYS